MYPLTRMIEILVAFLDTKGRSLVLLLISLVFIAGCAYSYSRGDNLPYIDEVDYYAIATNLLANNFYSNDGIEANADRAPILPFAFAGLMAIGGDIPQLRMMNFFFFAATLWFLFLLVRNLQAPSASFSIFAGALATTLAIGYPVLFYSAGTLFPQTLGGLLFVLVLYLLSTAETSWKMVGVGITFGLLLLTVPMFIFTLPVLLVWIVIVKKEPGLRAAAILLVSCFAIVSFWTIRNYVVFHSFVLLTSSSGAAFLWGNSPDATIGGAEVDYLVDSYDQSANLNQVEADRFKFKLALEQMRERKLEAVGFYFFKVLNYFSFVNDHYAKSEISIWKTAVMASTYCPLLLLFIARIALWKRYPPSAFEVLLIAIYISTAFSYAIFHTRIRYRLPYDYTLIAVVALFVSQWLSSRMPRKSWAIADGKLSIGPKSLQ